MSKIHKFCCIRHGVITIETEKPPILQGKAFCPWCGRRLSKAIEAEEVEQELKLEGAQA